MRATIKNLSAWVENPGPGAEQVINGRTPHKRGKSALDQARKYRRSQQVRRYNDLLKRAAETLTIDLEVTGELQQAVTQIRRDLGRGVIAPVEAMQVVAETIRNLSVFTEDAQVVADDAKAASDMIDMDPGDYEQVLLSRFPTMEQSLPMLTEEYLRGEADSPFDGLDGEAS